MSFEARLKAWVWDKLFFVPAPLLRAVFTNARIMRRFSSPSFALSQMDLKLEEFLPHRGGFFVEVGGNDGFSQSNTKFFELYKGWIGVLVEPYKPNFRRMLATRSRASFKFHGACVPFNYSSPNVSLTYSDLMTVSKSLPVDLENSEAHALSGEKFLRVGKVHDFKSPSLKLNDLLIQVDAPSRIDLFSLDVEGAEIAVLEGVDHQRFRFRYLLVESRSPDELDRFLIDIKYRFIKKLSHHDYLYEDCMNLDQPG